MRKEHHGIAANSLKVAMLLVLFAHASFAGVDLSITYFVQGEGYYKSSLESGGWLDHDRLDAIHAEVNSIWSQAGVHFTCKNRNHCAIAQNVAHDYWMKYKGPNTGTRPKGYRDRMRGADRLVEGLFLFRANYPAGDFWGEEVYPDVAIHLVDDVNKETNDRYLDLSGGVVGLFVPEGWRRHFDSHSYTSVIGRNAPPNMAAYLIVVSDSGRTPKAIARIIAHEIGHAFGLDDIKSPGNLMNWRTGPNNDSLTEVQIEIARRNWSRFKNHGPVSACTKRCYYK
jgi:hypothetical protein